MGSLCGQNNTTTQNTSGSSTQSYTPAGLSDLQSIWNRVQGVASQPYTPYGGQMVAGLDPTQTAGIANVNAGANAAQPYFNQAAQYATTGASQIDPNNIQRYMSPYTQNVVNATQAQFANNNAEQQSQVTGNAALRGALGGDRVGVAQAETARQQKLAQDPVIAGLYNNSYTQALGAAQSDRAAAAQGAYTFGALAPAVQNAQISGGQAQIGAGSVAQGNQQQQLSAAYNQYLQALAFPYQQASFLSSTGLPAVTGQGGTQTGSQTGQSTTTPPKPNIFGQFAGLGLAAYGAFSPSGGGGGGGSGGYATSTPNSPGASMYTGDPSQAGFGPTYNSRGGRIGYANGGDVPGSPYDNLVWPTEGRGYVPMVNPQMPSPPAQMQPMARPQFLDPPKSSSSQGMSMPNLSSMRNMFGGSGGAGGASGMGGEAAGAGDLGATGTAAFGADEAGMTLGADALAGSAAAEGGGAALADLLPLLLFAKRGGRINRYADGGDVSFDDRFPMAGDINSGANVMGNPMAAREALIRAGLASPYAPTPQTANLPMPQPRPAMADAAPPDLPPQIANPGGAPPMPPSAMSYDSPSPYGVQGGDSGAPMTPMSAPAPQTNPAPSGGLFNLSPEARQGMIAAGLGMMASRNPGALGAIGEGGLQGLKTYAEQKKERENKELQTKRVDIEAARLAQQAEQFSKTYGLHQEQFGETKKQRDLEREKYEVPTGFRRADGKLEPIPGGPHDPEILKAEADAKRGSGMSETAVELKARQVANGDLSALTNIGRGAQAGVTLERIANRGAQILTEEGGMSPAEAAEHMSRKLQEFKATSIGKSAEARTAGVREANLNLILKATEAAVPAALEASEAVARTGWVPLNKIIQGGEVIASNPELRRFGMANLQLAEHWARAMNPTGVMRESDRDMALKFLSTADSKDTYRQVVDQLQKQITRERDAVRGQRATEGGPSAGGPVPGAIPGSAVPSVGTRKQFKQGWGVWDGSAWVPEKP